MPQRFLRPGITNSERWNAISFEAQSFWTRLLTLVDDFGRYDGRPSVLCAQCFAVWNELHPDDVVNPQRTAALCTQLSHAKLAEFYEIEGRKVLQVLQWQERARSDSSKWPPRGSAPLRNPAESCGILPPSPLAISHKPSPLGGLELEIQDQKKEDPAQDILDHLNSKANRKFRPTETNIEFIAARLKEPGVTVSGIKKMVDRQVLRWLGTSQEEYLRPETLFNRTKFDAYYAAKDAPLSPDHPANGHSVPLEDSLRLRQGETKEQRDKRIIKEAIG